MMLATRDWDRWWRTMEQGRDSGWANIPEPPDVGACGSERLSESTAASQHRMGSVGELVIGVLDSYVRLIMRRSQAFCRKRWGKWEMHARRALSVNACGSDTIGEKKDGKRYPVQPCKAMHGSR